MSAEGVFSPHSGKGDSDKDKSEREERKDKERKKGNERRKAIGIQGQKDGGSPIQMPVHKSEDSEKPVMPPIQGLTVSTLFVVAIDFGTTYSGWAFSSRHDFLSDPLKVFSFNWNNGGTVMQKTNTCILFDEEGSKTGRYDACGFDAHEKYVQLCSENLHKEHFFFSCFKMILYENMDITTDTMISAVDGKKMNALVVFSETIRFFVEHFKRENAKLYDDVRDNEIRWVLTVPAIWNERAKKFMREAAIKAGISPTQLRIALEPEAAALFCKSLPLKKDNRIFSVFQPNTKYMVVDIGGGTFDITVSQVTQEGLEEIHRANGGNVGGTTVNKEFWNLLCLVYGEDVISRFRSKDPDDELRLEQSFEQAKKTVELNDKRGDIHMPIPLALHTIFTEGKTIDKNDQWKPNGFDGKIMVDFKKGKLQINRKVFENIFRTSVDEIYKSISELLSKPELSNLNAILMVGGFSDSPLLYEKLKAHIQIDHSDVQVLKPEQAITAVVKGAVYFGHEPNVFRKRVCRHTYGMKTRMPFDRTLDPSGLLTENENGVEYCRNRFSKHVTIGEKIKVGTFKEGKIYHPFRGDQKSVRIPVYVSKDRNPRYADNTCAYLGSCTLDLSNLPKEEEEIEVSMKFGETELATVKAREVKTNKEIQAELYFLG